MNIKKIKSTIHLANLSLLLLLYTASLTYAQSTKEILVGHEVPDINLNEMVNYKSKSAKISDFKGKLLILDFWATYCSPCVGMLPKTDSLQKQFAGKVQFLSVTKESGKKVAAFLANMSRVRHISPASVVNDTTLSSLFYYATIPFYVWIDPTGKVVATTGSEEINARNINAVLTGEVPDFVNRQDIRKRSINVKKSLYSISYNFNLKNPALEKEEITDGEFNSYTIASKYIENASNGQLVFDADHFAAFNVSLDFLYRFAYDAGYYDHPIRGAFDSKSSHRFNLPDSLLNKITDLNENQGYKEILNWSRKNAVCFEIRFPKGLSWKSKMEMLRADLDRYFAAPLGFTVHVEKQEDSIYVLKRINSSINLTTSSGSRQFHDDRYSYHQSNSTLTQLTSLLNGHYFQNERASFRDGTGYQTVDLDLNCDMANIASINTALEKYGLKFILTLSDVDVLIFTGRKM